MTPTSTPEAQREEGSAIYNARVAMRNRPSRFYFACSVALVLCLSTARARAGDWRAAEDQLAGKVAGVAGHATVAMTVVDRSSLTDAEVEDIRSGLEARFAAAGVQVGSGDQATSVQITLSENLRNYVWVAEIRKAGGEAAVVMVSMPRPEGTTSEHSATLIIHKALLWAQDGQIVDAAVADASRPPEMIVLGPESVSIYRLQGVQWQLEQTLPVAHEHPWPRDLRGRVVLRKDHLFDVFLPGVFCRTTASSPLALNCEASDDPWPVSADQFNLNAFFSPNRNFFTGALSPGIGKQQRTVGAFFSAAALPVNGSMVWLFTGVDGDLRQADGKALVSEKLVWGSDITSLHTGCGPGWHVLASSSGVEDALQIFELVARKPVAVSQQADFSGPILALWPDPDAASAFAVSHNSETGKYEVYRLSVTCGL